MMIINMIAIIAIVFAVFGVFSYPCVIGKSRPPFSYAGWIEKVLQGIIMVALSGRVLGWW